MLDPPHKTETPAEPKYPPVDGSLTSLAPSTREGSSMSTLHEDCLPAGIEPSSVRLRKIPWEEPEDEPVQGFDPLCYELGPTLRRDEL